MLFAYVLEPFLSNFEPLYRFS